MSETFEINAEARSDMGKGASRRLRRAGMVPGIIYGAHKDPELISMNHNDLLTHLQHEAFYSHILKVNVGGATQQVILKDLQRHPAKPFVLHADFLRVSADEKIRTHVPLHFTNEATAPGVKMGGQISHHLTDVEINCLPKDLPEYIAIDVGAMNVGDSIHLTQVKLPAGVEIIHIEQDLPVVSLSAARGGGEAAEGEEGEE